MKIKPLTSLRFFFAVMVFFNHTSFIFNHEQFRSTHNPYFTQLCNRYFNEGYVGVSFFFMLSGFILSLNYKDKLINNATSFKDFWMARVARIYPLHLFTLLIAIPVSLNGMLTVKSFWFGKLLLNLLLLQSFVPDHIVYFGFNDTSWSLSDEMFFYLLFPFIVMAYFRYGKSIKLGLLALLVLIPLAIYLSPAGLRQDLFYINPVSRFVDFFIGILLYQLYEKVKPGTLLRSVFALTIAEVAVVGLFIMFFAFHSSIPQGYRYSCYYWIPVMLIIYVFAQQGGYLSKLLSNKILVLAGEISFSFYLLHHLVIKYISFINAKLFIIHYDYLLVVIIFIFSVVASYFSYYFVEIPSNRFIKGKYKAFTLSSPAVIA